MNILPSIVTLLLLSSTAGTCSNSLFFYTCPIRRTVPDSKSKTNRITFIFSSIVSIASGSIGLRADVLNCVSDSDDAIADTFPVCIGRDDSEYCNGVNHCEETNFCSCGVGWEFCATRANPCSLVVSIMIRCISLVALSWYSHSLWCTTIIIIY